MQKKLKQIGLPSNERSELSTRVKKRLNCPVALVGLMGSGKSTIGHKLAKELELRFIDVDNLIVKRAGVSISEIFDLAGEKKFREMEFKALTEIVLSEPKVIATGGGAFCQQKNSSILLKKTIVVWLKAKPKTLMKRIGNSKSRPLLNNAEQLNTLSQLLKDRTADYSKAHLHVDTDSFTTKGSVLKITEALDNFLEKL